MAVDGADDLSPADAEALARDIEAGRDAVVVPQELTDEAPEQPPDETRARSLYAQILAMPMGGRIKLALRGNKDARAILLRDSNKLVRRFVILNPRITDGEVLAIARTRNIDDEMLRIITEHREWMRNYQIRHALTTNPKTPLPISLRLVANLLERDMRQVARSKNVPEAVAAHARRLLFARHERGS